MIYRDVGFKRGNQWGKGVSSYSRNIDILVIVTIRTAVAPFSYFILSTILITSNLRENQFPRELIFHPWCALLSPLTSSLWGWRCQPIKLISFYRLPI